MRDKLSIIATPTHECNLSCRYCYKETSENGRMTEETLKKAIERVCEFSDSSLWIWHGGEPLLMGVDFYRQIRDIQGFYRKKGKRFRNGIQSNGTLLNEEFVDFMVEAEDFDLGLSIDGPRRFHDQTRIYEDGNGSYSDVIRAVKLLRDNKRKVGVCSVINATNVNHPEEVYEFFKIHRIDVKINPLTYSGNVKQNQDLEITPIQYGKFLMKMWNVYNEDSKDGVKIDIDPFMEVLGNLATGCTMGCNYSASCRDCFISIDPKGDVSPCGRFDGLEDFRMGNVHSDSIDSMIAGEVHTKLAGRTADTISDCKKCEYGNHCGGGCMHYAHGTGDVMEKDPYCTAYKMLFNKMKQTLQKEGLEVKNGR